MLDVFAHAKRLGSVARAEERVEVATELAQPLVMAAHRARDVDACGRGRAVGSAKPAGIGGVPPAADSTPARLARKLVEHAPRRDAVRRLRENVNHRSEHVARRLYNDAGVSAGLARGCFLRLVEVAVEIEGRGMSIGRVCEGVRSVVHIVELDGHARAFVVAAAR